MTPRPVTLPPAPALASVSEAIGQLPPIDLAGINAKAALQRRIDTKFIIQPETLLRLLDHFDQQLEVLTIADKRAFTYDSVYFDTAHLRTFREHLQGRRRRFKVRTRSYVDSNFTVLEVKTKGLRGRTEKLRINHEADAATLNDTALGFITETLENYEIDHAREVANSLQPQLRTGYRRVTLVGKYRPFRLTLDATLALADEDQATHTLADRVLVEAKTADDRDPVISALHHLGVREVKMSKYCAGISLLKPQIPHAPWNPVINRHLRPRGAWRDERVAA